MIKTASLFTVLLVSTCPSYRADDVVARSFVEQMRKGDSTAFRLLAPESAPHYEWTASAQAARRLPQGEIESVDLEQFDSSRQEHGVFKYTYWLTGGAHHGVASVWVVRSNEQRYIRDFRFSGPISISHRRRSPFGR
jgi:hypothetical protein